MYICIYIYTYIHLFYCNLRVNPRQCRFHTQPAPVPISHPIPPSFSDSKQDL